VTAKRASPLALAALLCCACGSEAPAEAPAGAATPAAPYASELVSFEPGDGSGFGEDSLPGVVFGPPEGKGNEAGSLDVLSLGKGGSIVLGFGSSSIADGEGPDFIVFENAFWAGGDPAAVFAEPGEVSVSDDGEHWETFACDGKGDGSGRYAGCAGFTPTLEYDPTLVAELDPLLTGGDAFDLAEVGLETARYVRVRDVSELGAAPTAGFDLDAVGIAHPGSAPP
jgi:hypothetical protein